MIRQITAVSIALILSACTLDLAAPAHLIDGLPPGFEVEVSVDPSEIEPGDAFTLQIRMRNTTDDTMKIVTGNSCLFNMHSLHGDEGVLFDLSPDWWGCRAVVTTHTFAPGEVREPMIEMKALILTGAAEELESTLPPSGIYRVGIEFDTITRNSKGQKPVVDTELRIR